MKALGKKIQTLEKKELMTIEELNKNVETIDEINLNLKDYLSEIEVIFTEVPL